MRNIKEYIESGILELYVLGMLNPKEIEEVGQMVSIYPDIEKELDRINTSLKHYANLHAIKPKPVVKLFLMSIIDYENRLQKGEPVTFPPLLHEGSKIEDYAGWLDRSDMKLHTYFSEIYAKIIGYTSQVITAIVWIEYMAPQEVHHNEYEKFLIVEGTCDIIIEGKIYSLVVGDYFAIPLHKSHKVKVTSSIPCKVILQRVTA